jgi:HPt (histidine-containing phosphotransfer) domain-containing protein
MSASEFHAEAAANVEPAVTEQCAPSLWAAIRDRSAPRSHGHSNRPSLERYCLTAVLAFDLQRYSRVNATPGRQHFLRKSVGCQRVGRTLAGDETLFGEVARVFIRTLPPLLNAVSAALTANDLPRAALEAHSVKGAVAAFEAPKVFTSLALVERSARNYNRDAAATAFANAKQLVERLLTELAGIAAT